MERGFHFSADHIERDLAACAGQGITELVLHDAGILSHKGKLLHFLQAVVSYAPGVFVTLPVDASVLDMDVAKAAAAVNCSLEIPLDGTDKGGAYLFDKRFYARRANMLNTMGLVFGVALRFACAAGDSVRLFRDRLDFAVSLMPNHIDFPQIEPDGAPAPRPSATFSTQDIRAVTETAFACKVFYSAGRAVAWFSSVLDALKMNASAFFRDFAEWQRVNNCSLSSSWDCDRAGHAEIESMQCAFLRFKLEEKNRAQLFPVVSDIVRLNGALSRCCGEGTETVVPLRYHPDDLLSPAALRIASFAENAFIESCNVRVFVTDGGVDYEIIGKNALFP